VGVSIRNFCRCLSLIIVTTFSIGFISEKSVCSSTLIELRQLEEVLDHNTLLLEYRLGDERSFLHARTVTSSIRYRLPCRGEIEELARQAYQHVTARSDHRPGEPRLQWHSRVIKSDEKYREAASRLSDILLGPVADQLGKKRLLILTEGFLQHLSFAALPIPGQLKATERGAVLLAADNESVMVESGSSPVRKRRCPDKEGLVLVWADPVFETDDPRLGETGNSLQSPYPEPHQKSRGAESDEAEDVCRLPHSGHEAAAIMKLVQPGKGTCHRDFEASREQVLSADLAGYRVLHIATHAVSDGLLLSAWNEEGRNVANLLSLEDIYSMDLSAELVVLSACNTARTIKNGHSCMGSLADGFLAAGAQRVLASLWKVDDGATEELMKYFYENFLQKNMTASAALKSAQMILRQQENWSAPYYWASFVLLER